MPWNDEIFRDEIEKAAARQGKATTAALKEAGLSSGTMTHPPENGRRTDIFERLMPVLGWSPIDIQRIIAACFDWPWPPEIDGPSRSRHGEVHIILRNVDVRVSSTSESWATATTQSD